MVNYVKGIKALSEVLRKNAKNLADSKANPKSLYKHFSPEQQQAVVDSALQQMQLHHKDLNNLDEKDFIRYMTSESRREGNASKIIKEYEANKPVVEPDLHKRNFELEKQADDFLRKNDPEFFEELEQAMRSYEANTTNMPRDEMVEQIASQLDNYYDNDMSEAFREAITNQSKKDFIKNLYADELDNIVPQQENLLYHLSRDPLENASEISFPETTLNKRYHNVAMPRGKYYFEGQHKPADYYHNILWNYINKGPKRDAMLEEFFQDILHKPTPTNSTEKFNTIKRYKDALDKRRLELDMKNKPYNKDKLTNMKAIEEYFENQRPYSFEDFESSTLSPSSTPNFEHDYYNFIRNKATSTNSNINDVNNINTLHEKALKADKTFKKYKEEAKKLKKLYKKN